MRTNRARGVDVADLDVVVVEPSKPVQGIVRSILFAARVARVRVFDDPEEAYRAMLVEPPHLVIVANELSGIDGMTLVRTLRDPRSGPLVAVPAILTTANPTRGLVERAIAVGVHYVLAKPLSPANVMNRIEAVIRDERVFVLEKRLGYHVLQDHDELLAGQRERWKDFHTGAGAFPTARKVEAKPQRKPAAPEKPVAPQPVAKQPAPAPAAAAAPVSPKAAVKPSAPNRPASRSLGFSASHRSLPRETSTGQSAPRTA